MSKPRFFMGPAGAATDKRLNMTDLRVLCILGTFTNNKGWCFPRQETLAELLSRSRPVVNASLKRLEECGYVESKKRKGGANRKLYRVILDVREDAHDLPDGLFEVERDVDPTDISISSPPPDVCPADMSAPSTCLPGKQFSKVEVSAPPTIDVGPADMQRELEPLNQKRKRDAASPPVSKKTFLPEDWDPRDEEVHYAESLNFSKKQFDLMLEDFRTHWFDKRPHAAGKKSNWNLTFRKWIANQATYWKTDRQKPAPWTAASVIIGPDWSAALREFMATGAWKPSLGPTPDKRAYRGPTDLFAELTAGKDPNNAVIAGMLAHLETQKEGMLL